MKNFKRYLAGALVGMMILGCVACGKKDKKEKYVSPNFNTATTTEAEIEVATMSEASMTDALEVIASMSDATMTDASEGDTLPASLTDALPMGVYEENAYYNLLGGFKLTVDNVNWYFYDAKSIADITGESVDDINNLWYGYKSPKEVEISYGAVAYNETTGSNILVTVVSPSAYNMPELTAEKYLSISAEQYQNVALQPVQYLGQDYIYLEVPAEETQAGRRVQLAKDADGMIVLITFTLQDDSEIESALKMFSAISK